MTCIKVGFFITFTLFFSVTSFCQVDRSLVLIDKKGKLKEISFKEISEIELSNNIKFQRLDSIKGNIWIINKYDMNSDSIIQICISEDSIITIRKIRVINRVAFFVAPALYFLYLSFNDLVDAKYQNSIINFGGFVGGVIAGTGISYIWPHKKYKLTNGKWKIRI